MMPAMRYTHTGKADLNLLLTFQVLIEERSITRAARRMFLSQPAMSRAFDRLQEMLKDELLVRTSKGYEPTKRAALAYRELNQLLPRVEQLLQGTEFKPARATDVFRVAAGPYASVWLVPSMVESITRQAPHTELEVGSEERGFVRLESNEVDLVLTGFEVPPSLRSSILVQEPWVCLVRANHPLAKGRLTWERYLSAGHVSGQQTLLEQNLKRLGRRRAVRVSMIDFFPIGVVVERTDLVATLALRTALKLVKITKTKIVQPAFDLGTFSYSQAWHPRNDSDPSHKWLRDVMQDVATRNIDRLKRSARPGAHD